MVTTRLSVPVQLVILAFLRTILDFLLALLVALGSTQATSNNLFVPHASVVHFQTHPVCRSAFPVRVAHSRTHRASHNVLTAIWADTQMVTRKCLAHLVRKARTRTAHECQSASNVTWGDSQMQRAKLNVTHVTLVQVQANWKEQRPVLLAHEAITTIAPSKIVPHARPVPSATQRKR
jgi:hypothetical protein